MEYKSLSFLKNVIEKKFMLPKKGKLIQFGVDDGETLKRLCEKWGEDRVIGYDIYPKLKHRNIETFDLNKIGQKQMADIAFCDVDVGDFNTHWKLRLKLVRWSAPQVVTGGIIMCNSPMVTDNVWGEDGHDYLIKNGFDCYRFSRYAGEGWYSKILRQGIWNPATWCLYRKKQNGMITKTKRKGVDQ